MKKNRFDFSSHSGFLFLLLAILNILNGVESDWKFVNGNVPSVYNGVYGIKGVPSSTNIPGARYRQNTWYINNTMFMFGGNGVGATDDPSPTNDGFMNDFWKFDGSMWTWIGGQMNKNYAGVWSGPASGPNDIPGGRLWATSFTTKTSIYLFGGLGFSVVGSFGSLNDLWRYDGNYWYLLSNNPFTINNPGNYGTKNTPSITYLPSARAEPTGWVDSSGNLWLFGGRANNTVYTNDLWTYNPVTTEWTWVSGFANNSTLGGVYGYPYVASPTYLPSARAHSTSWIDSQNNAYIFGGFGFDAIGGFGYLGDLWKYDNTGSWSLISGYGNANYNGVYGQKGVASSGNFPGSRGFSVGWILADDSLILFGGEGGADNSANYVGDLNDLWKFKNGLWTWISGNNKLNQPSVYGVKGVADANNTPGNRFSASSYKDKNNDLYLYGGCNYNFTLGGKQQELWAFTNALVLTTGIVTTVSITTSPLTTGLVTTSSISTSEISTSEITTSLLNGVTTGNPIIVTSSSITTEEITTDSPEVTSSNPDTSAATTGVASQAITTGASIVTTNIVTTGGGQAFTTGFGIVTTGVAEEATTGAILPNTGNNVITPPPEKGGSPAGAIVGGIIGGLIVLAVLAILLFFFVRRRKKKEEDSANIELSSAITPNSDQDTANFIIPYKDIDIGRKLGNGAFGEVFKGEYNGTKVAVKRIVGTSITPQQIEEFKSEAKTMINIPPHPNVVLFRGITVSPDPFCIVLELCKKGSLLTYLRSSAQITDDDKIKFAKDIARGMLHLHSGKANFQVIHRDLAARNILIKQGDVCAVSDFGMARMKETEEDASTTKQEIGPMKWMAPESIKFHQYSVKSDVFSYGVVLYEIVTRSDPWPKFSNVAAGFEVLAGKRMTIPENCPTVLSEIMQSCWKQDAEERPTFKEIIQTFKSHSIEEKFYNPTRQDSLERSNSSDHAYVNTSTQNIQDHAYVNTTEVDNGVYNTIYNTTKEVSSTPIEEDHYN